MFNKFEYMYSYIDKDILKHYFFEEESSDEDSKAINKYNQKKLFRRLTTRKLSNQNKESISISNFI